MSRPWRILLLDTKESNPNHYICVAVGEALRAHADVELVVKASYHNAVSLARENRCNLFLALDGEGVVRSVCRQVGAVCGLSAVWLTEDPYELELNLANRDLFDLVFTNDRACVHAYGPRGRHLPFAASQILHSFPVREDGDCRYDVLFVGTAWPNRVEFLTTLRARLKSVRLKVALPHNEFLPVPDIGRPRSEFSWRASCTEFVRIANRSRIVLTLHRRFSGSGGGETASTPGPRLFEVALGGGFQLVDTTLDETEQYFRLEKEIAGFDSTARCLSQIERFLANPSMRIEMARAAQRRAAAEHLYAHRVAMLLAELDRIKPRTPAPRIAHRPVVLLVSHNISGRQPFGGVEVYQDQIEQMLRGQFDFLTYAPSTEHSAPNGYALWRRGQEIAHYRMESGYTDAVLTCPERESAFAEVLDQHHVELVHFQHLLGHPLSLPYISHAHGIPNVASLHDYYLVCRHFLLIGFEGRFCQTFERPIATCDVCLDATDGLAAGSQAKRRAFIARMLGQLDVLHMNTRGVADSFARLYPRVERCEHFISPVPIPPAKVTSRRDTSGPLRVAAIGNFTREKGGDVLIRVFNQMRADPVEFHVFGDVREPFTELFKILNFENVVVHGAYEPAAIPTLLEDMDVGLYLSIWPETYVLTLSEGWRAGIVPIVSDLGALGERVAHGENGFKVPVGDPGSVIALLRHLIANPDVVTETRRQITEDLWMAADHHMVELNALYRRLLNRSVAWRDPAEGARLTLKRCGVTLVDPCWPVAHPIPQAVIPPEAGNGRVPMPMRVLHHLREHGAQATLRKIADKVRAAL